MFSLFTAITKNTSIHNNSDPDKKSDEHTKGEPSEES
jgi:hypothetical protein